VISIIQNEGQDIRGIIMRSPVADIPEAMDVMNEWMYRSNEIYYGLVNGKVACVWGFIQPTILSDTAYLWLLTTDIVAQHKFLLVRHSQMFIEEALKTWPTIIGNCAIDDTKAIRWIKWLGGEFDRPDGKWLPFSIRKRAKWPIQ
jgi:hypothetical protein